MADLSEIPEAGVSHFPYTPDPDRHVCRYCGVSFRGGDSVYCTVQCEDADAPADGPPEETASCDCGAALDDGEDLCEQCRADE